MQYQWAVLYSFLIASQAFMLFTLMLTSKGIAGAPRAVLAILLGMAAPFHLSIAPVLMVLGIAALIDTGRTSLNVFGNCLASAVVAQWEACRAPKKGEFKRKEM